ncbi:hypothetical protein Tco_0158848 [Tanacetum coccineum]
MDVGIVEANEILGFPNISHVSLVAGEGSLSDKLLNGFSGDPLPVDQVSGLHVSSSGYGGILEKDSAPLLTVRQEETVRLLESHKAPFRRYPECFLCQVGLSKYYPFDDNSYPAYEYSNGSDMGLLDFIQTTDPRKVREVEVQKGADQVTLLESTKDFFMPLVIPAAGRSSSTATTEVSVPIEERQESVAPEDAYLNLADPDEDAVAVRQGEERVVSEQPKKKRILKQSDALPAKKLSFVGPGTACCPGGILEKDSAPLLTARQEETVRLLESHKAPFRRYPECFLCQVGLSKYYPFDDNSYPAYEYSNGSDMGLLDFIQTADPRKVRAVEVQKGADQVTLLESTKDCFMPLVIPAAGGSSSAAAAEVPVPTEERQEDVAPEDAYLNLADPDEDAIAVRQGEERVVSEQPKKVKRRRLVKQSDALPAKKLRTDHPSLASGTGGKTLANLEQIMPEGSHLLAQEQPVAPSVVPPSQEGEGFVDLSAQGSFQILATAESSGTLSAPVDTAAAGAITSTRPATASKAATDVGPSHPEESESSDDSFYEIPNVDPAMAKRWYVPKWNITNFPAAL